ncbi:MAG TPA: O-antigen ligase family protein [Chloroflexota bacterium]|nr:O-antigen ligase family protein [Chloroflexota bacterium]
MAGNVISPAPAAFGRSSGQFWLDQERVAILILAGVAVALVLGPMPIVVLAAIGYLVVAIWQPVPALALVIVSLPFIDPVHLGKLDFGPTEVLIVLATLAGGVRLTRRLWGPHDTWRWRVQEIRRHSREAFGDPAISVLAILFILAGAVSLTASVALPESLRSFRTIIVEPALFYFLIVTQVRGRRAVVTLIGALVLAGVLISLVGFWQYATDRSIITAEAGLRRIRAFYGSPNNLGLFLGRILPFTFSLGLWWKRSRPVWVAAGLVIGIAIILTFSIGAWAGVTCSAFAVAGLAGPRARQWALRTAVIGVVVGAVAAWRIPRIGDHFDLRWGTSFIRLEVWQSAARMLALHPVRGIGLDNFLYYYQHGYRLPSAWQEPDLSHPHNMIFDFWLSLGLPGLILLGFLIGRFAEAIVEYWAMSDWFERGVYAGAIGAMIDIVVHGLVDNSFFLPDLAVLFWLMFAIVGVLQREQRRRAHLSLRR